MKIGILTFHCAHNYGAVLQCYALQEFLNHAGHEVKVINYRPKYLLQPYRVINRSGFRSTNPLRIVKSIARELLLAPIRYIRHRNFNKFINSRLALTHTVTKDEIPSDFDVYIVGSDQIWNPNITRGFDKVYFCDFQFPKNNKIYMSYAASMEAKQVSDEDERFYREVLANLDHISVREIDLKNILQPLTDKNIFQVLDPTILIKNEVWENITPTINIKEKYVLTYQVRMHKETELIARRIADQLGAKVINLVAWVRLNQKDTYQTASPEMFLAMIKNAECTVTTSFHGTAFSIIYNRPFYAIKLNDGKDSRVASLLSALNLEDRLIDTNANPNFSVIDYTEANYNLDKLRQFSQSYLNSSIVQ